MADTKDCGPDDCCNHYVALHSMLDALEACPDPCCRVVLCQAIDCCLAGCVVPPDPMPMPDGGQGMVRQGFMAAPAGFSWAEFLALIQQAKALGIPWGEIIKIVLALAAAKWPSLQPLVDLINQFLAKQPKLEPAK